MVWAAGVKASPLGRKLAERLAPGIEVDKAGRVTVAEDCSVPGHPDVFVVGDLALFKQDDKPLPGLAPVAMQQGKYVAKVIDRRLRGKAPPVAVPLLGPRDDGDHRPQPCGGRRSLVPAQWLRRLAGLAVRPHYVSGEVREPIAGLIQWFWNYVSRNRTARLITGQHALDELSVRREATAARRRTARRPVRPRRGTTPRTCRRRPVALVTGASAGIGKELVRRFAGVVTTWS